MLRLVSSTIAGLPIPAEQKRKMGRSWKEPVLKAFAIEVSDSDEEEDAQLGGDRLSPAASLPASTAAPHMAGHVAHSWDLLTAVEKHGSLDLATASAGVLCIAPQTDRQTDGKSLANEPLNTAAFSVTP